MAVTFATGTITPPTTGRRAGLLLSEANAVRLLQVLGYPTGGPLTGASDPAAFLGRILIALAFTDPPRERYLSNRLNQLHDLAEHGIAEGGVIVWTSA